MAATHETYHPTGKPLEGATLTVVIPLGWHIRLWLAYGLIRLACWIVGASVRDER